MLNHFRNAEIFFSVDHLKDAIISKTCFSIFSPFIFQKSPSYECSTKLLTFDKKKVWNDLIKKTSSFKKFQNDGALTDWRGRNSVFVYSYIYLFIFEKSYNHHNMSAIYHALKNCINQAIDELYHGIYTNCVVAVCVFDIAFRTLQRRWNEDKSKNNRQSVGKTLTNKQKQTIKDCIHRLDSINQCVCPKMIVSTANFFISFENCTIGHF